MQLTRWSLLTAYLAALAPVRAEENEGDQDIEEDSLTVDQLRSLHSKFDSDGDGKVSLEEILSFSHGIGQVIARQDVGAILEEIDTNKDGKLSLEEHLNDIHNQADGGDEQELQELERRKRLEAAKHSAADLDQNGELDEDELPALFYPEIQRAVLKVAVEEAMRMKDKDGDGQLSVHEFWEVTDGESGDSELSEEERNDFGKLDENKDGFMDLSELSSWESGQFHTREAMKLLIELADKDSDMHITAEEFEGARELISASDAQYHLVEWAEHHEL